MAGAVLRVSSCYRVSPLPPYQPHSTVLYWVRHLQLLGWASLFCKEGIGILAAMTMSHHVSNSFAREPCLLHTSTWGGPVHMPCNTLSCLLVPPKPHVRSLHDMIGNWRKTSASCLELLRHSSFCPRINFKTLSYIEIAESLRISVNIRNFIQRWAYQPKGPMQGPMQGPNPGVLTLRHVPLDPTSRAAQHMAFCGGQGWSVGVLRLIHNST